jgi:TRAP-type C4-dicarboxylate transport system substrate-binding protein
MFVRQLILGTTLLLVAAPAAGVTLKIATVVPEGSAWVREMRGADATIRERTAGRVKLKFYPGGVMGNDQTVLRKIRAGQLHGGAFTSGSLTALYQNVDLYSVPLMFRSFDEVDYVRSKMDGSIRDGLARAGMEVLAISDGGFAHLLSQKPVRNISDLEGTKVWVLENDVLSRTALELAGVSPVPLSIADVYTGLQTGLIDTVVAPPMAAIAFQWHTKVRYLTDVPLVYLAGVLAVDRKAFDRLSADDRGIVREVLAEASARLDRDGRVGDEQAKRALVEHGVETVSASSPEELTRWHAIAEQALQALHGSGLYSREMIEDLLGHISRYRESTPASHE